MSFDHLSPLLAEALAARGYEALTPVQAQVTEAEAHGRDLLVSAQTGSGKTVAFGLAMADELFDDGRLPFATAPLALIVAPTRELALQVSRELGWLYARAGARRSEEHTSELQSLMRISYAVFCLKKKKTKA